MGCGNMVGTGSKGPHLAKLQIANCRIPAISQPPGHATNRSAAARTDCPGNFLTLQIFRFLTQPTPQNQVSQRPFSQLCPCCELNFSRATN